MNSPVVRGDSLRFRKDGVKEIVSKVILPLANSYKFYSGQAALLKSAHGIDFKWSPNNNQISENVMDLWILAKCQSLIRIVREEMEGM